MGGDRKEGKDGGGEEGEDGEMGRGEGGRRGGGGEGKWEEGRGGEEERRGRGKTGRGWGCSNIHKYLNLASKELVLCSLKFILINKRLLSGAINIEK